MKYQSNASIRHRFVCSHLIHNENTTLVSYWKNDTAFEWNYLYESLWKASPRSLSLEMQKKFNSEKSTIELFEVYLSNATCSKLIPFVLSLVDCLLSDLLCVTIWNQSKSHFYLPQMLLSGLCVWLCRMQNLAMWKLPILSDVFF